LGKVGRWQGTHSVPFGRLRLSRTSAGAVQTITRVSSIWPKPDGCQVFVQPGGLRKGCDAHHHGELRLFKDLRGESQLVGQRQAPWRHGIDATGPLGLARVVAHQPAVQPALLRRRAGIDAGVFDAA
jgi:hypothetical protein